jgi:two-component system, sensor histidine kinase ChiS
MKKTGSRFLYGTVTAVLLIVLLVSTFAHGRSAGSWCGQTEQGVIDLRGCGGQEGFLTRLDGNWEIYWDRLLTPEDFQSGGSLPGPDYIEVPKQWLPGMEGPAGHNGEGAATYRARLLLPEEFDEYAIKLNNARVASRLYVDGELLGSSGIPGYSKAETKPRNKPYEVFFRPEHKEVELVVQVANFSYISGGISEQVYFGDDDSINRLTFRNNSYDLGITVCLLVLSVFFFGQSLQRNRDRASFFLAVFSLCAALYLVTHSEKLLYDFIPALSYEWFSKLQAMSAFIGYWGLAGYMYYIISYVHNRLVFFWTGVAMVINMFIVLVNDAAGFAFMAYVVSIEGIVVIGYVIYVMARGIASRMDGYIYLIVGMMGILQFIAVQMVNLAWAVDVYTGIPYSIPLFALAQSLFLSSRYNHAYRTIRGLSNELKRKDRDKDEFLINTSHELRKPLEAIATISRSMTEAPEGELSGHDRENLTLIMITARRLSLLVNDIIDYERIKNGSIELDLKETDAAPAVDMVLEIFRHLSRNHAVSLASGIDAATCYVMADENRLIQILYSLADAAYRHSDEGTIRVYAEQEEPGHVCIVVEYSGRMLPPERLEAALGYGTQQTGRILDTDYDESILGLQVAAQLARMQHAGIRFEQQEGLNRFSVVFPGELRLGEPKTAGLSAAVLGRKHALRNHPSEWESGRQAAGGDKPYRVLIVDDDYVHVKALTNVLSAQGYITVNAAAGSEALRLLTGGNIFDLCVMNVKISDMPGLSLCRIIRETYGLLDLPVLLSTSRPYVGMYEAGAAAGANDFIHKPYEWEDVKARIHTLVQLKRMVSQLLDSEIAMLRAQIKPHFLYNAINTIIWMSKRDIEQCRQLLRDLSQFLRGSFDFGNRESMVQFETELTLIQAYLSLEKARFGERLNVVYELADTDFLIPPLMVQPIVENAVRHGITQKEEGGTVYISAMEESGYWKITVADDGVGMSGHEIAALFSEGGIPERSRGTGIGLTNINRRLIRQFGQPLSLRPRPGGGTEVTIRLPRS